MIRKSGILVLVMCVACGADVLAGVTAGRVMLGARDVQLWVTAGSITDLEGDVKETTRTYYEATGRYEDQEDRESYSFDDFGMDGGYPTLGIAFENAGRFFTFHFGASFFQPDVSAVARRNYYIGVDSVSFGGEEYEYMKIPEGQAFTVDMFAGTFEIRGMFTPVTLSAGNAVHFTPYVNFGLFILASSYDIDAGPASGVVQYLDPPENFVEGGQGDGSLAGGLPELGLGGELRIGREDTANLVMRLDYAGFQFSGDTGMFTSEEHRNKDIELDHLNIKFSAQVEVPVRDGRCLTLGVDYTTIESEASITSKEYPAEEVIERHERFDKDADFGYSALTARLGLTF